MLDLEGHTPVLDSPLPASDLGALLLSPVPAAAPRTITPRRPLRLSPMRDDAAADPRQPLAALNIFSDVFDPEPVAESDAGIDPRILASRRRARMRLDHSLNTLAADEANFWHASIADLPVPSTNDPRDAMIAANDLPDLPAPLHEQLARVRQALYAEGLDEDARILERPSTQLRLATHAMNATLVVVAFPLGAAVTTYTLLRGANLRLSTQAMAVVAGLLGFMHTGLAHLL